MWRPQEVGISPSDGDNEEDGSLTGRMDAAFKCRGDAKWSDLSSSLALPFLYRRHDKARDLDMEVYNSVLVAYSHERTGNHAASAMRLLDWMEGLTNELNIQIMAPNGQIRC
mmetsp:Transcript_1438/g.3648  ORF Transcript_1438/g.3648 Transcript_1438/m.3648 type:complete len:112 (+) Transcript_1438:215-550(+)